MTVLSPTYDRVSIAGAKAIRAIVGSRPHQIQGRRADAFVPAAVACDKTQGPDTGRGLVSPVLFSHSHRLAVSSRSSRKRVCLIPPGQTRTYSRSAGTSRARDLSRKLTGTSPSACINTLAHKQVVQAVAYVPHLNHLSKPSSLAGFKTSQKVLQGHGNRTQGRGFFTQGSARND